MTFAQTIDWIVRANGYSFEFTAGCGGDLEYAGTLEFDEACDQLRNALGGGEIAAWGDRGGGEFDQIPAIHWATQPVRLYGSGSYLSPSPYTQYFVARDQVASKWPIPRSTGDQPISAARRGRPREFEDDDLRRWASEHIAARPDISRTSLVAAIVADYPRHIGNPSGTINESTVRRRLQELNLP